LRFGWLSALLLLGYIEAFGLSSQEIEAIQLQIAKEREKKLLKKLNRQHLPLTSKNKTSLLQKN